MNNDHISDKEVEQDIQDTEKEIAILEHKLVIARNEGDRLESMKAESGIRERREFVEKLNKILDERKTLHIQSPEFISFLNEIL